MKDAEEVWAYDEPHESGGNCHITMTRRQAIAWMRPIYQRKCPDMIVSDKEIFEEWIAVNWAYEESTTPAPIAASGEEGRI